jgi:hypothetical protein
MNYVLMTIPTRLTPSAYQLALLRALWKLGMEVCYAVVEGPELWVIRLRDVHVERFVYGYEKVEEIQGVQGQLVAGCGRQRPPRECGAGLLVVHQVPSS